MDEDVPAPTKDDKEAIAEAIHYSVGQICEEVGARLRVRFSAPVMATVADLAVSQLDVYAQDLAAFAKHAKRSTISTDDVKLLVRRNPSLKTHIEDKAAQWGSDQPEKKERKKRASKKQKDTLSSPAHLAEDETSDQTDAEAAGVADVESRTSSAARPSSAALGGGPKTSSNPDSSRNDPAAKWPNFQLGFDDFDTVE